MRTSCVTSGLHAFCPVAKNEVLGRRHVDSCRAWQLRVETKLPISRIAVGCFASKRPVKKIYMKPVRCTLVRAFLTEETGKSRREGSAYP